MYRIEDEAKTEIIEIIDKFFNKEREILLGKWSKVKEEPITGPILQEKYDYAKDILEKLQEKIKTAIIKKDFKLLHKFLKRLIKDKNQLL